jgi:hypothetical protein
LVFHRNLPVIPAQLIKYYNHPSFRGGGTGRQPGLGGKATEQALILLVVSILFALVAVLETSPATPARSRPGQVRQESWFQWPVFGPGSHSKEWDDFMSFEE